MWSGFQLLLSVKFITRSKVTLICKNFKSDGVQMLNLKCTYKKLKSTRGNTICKPQ